MAQPSPITVTIERTPRIPPSFDFEQIQRVYTGGPVDRTLTVVRRHGEPTVVNITEGPAQLAPEALQLPIVLGALDVLVGALVVPR